ncbi:MAG: response regulator [Planctomycetaceae bacterium]|nr:response regulator [Planctomycetaceae bacterium]
MVSVIDNDAETRESLKFLLESKEIPVSTFSSADEFLKNWKPERTGCVVVDVRMPGMTGCDLQIELNRLKQNVPLILMTGYGDIQLAVEAMKRGALHFFEKPMEYPELLGMIEKGLALNTAARIEAAEQKEFEDRYSKLSPKECVIAELVAEGLTSHEIAERLNIVAGTVDLHRSRIYEKLECRNVADLVRMLVTGRVTRTPPNGKK